MGGTNFTVRLQLKERQQPEYCSFRFLSILLKFVSDQLRFWTLLPYFMLHTTKSRLRPQIKRPVGYKTSGPSSPTQQPPNFPGGDPTSKAQRPRSSLMLLPCMDFQSFAASVYGGSLSSLEPLMDLSSKLNSH